MINVATYKVVRIIWDCFFIAFFVSALWEFSHGRLELPITLVALFIFLLVGSLMHSVLTFKINKYSNWIKQAKEFSRGGVGEVSHISQSSAKENGRNLSVLSVKYKGYEVSFPGCDPDFAFKYRVGDAISIKVHETDDQRFVPAEFAKMK